jgi:hypothetical protein
VEVSREDRLRTIVAVGSKFMQAVEHLKRLDEAAKQYSEDKGYLGLLCIGEPNSQRTKLLLKVQGNVEFPEVEWGIMIGDAVHCLRSGLDQLVAGLCTEKATSSTRFPTCRTEREWIVDAPRMYWSLPPAYVAVLNRAQPYHRGNDAHSHPLAILNALWNLDKHYAIPAAALVPASITADVIEKQGITLGEFRTRSGVALKDGAVIAEAKVALDGSGLQPKVRVSAHITVSVGFGIIKTAPSLNLKPVAKTFQDLLLPAAIDVLSQVQAVQDDAS